MKNWSQLLSFVNRGYSDWHNIAEKQKKQIGKEYHNTSMAKGFGIADRFKKVGNTIDYKNNKNIQNGYKIYPQNVEHCTENEVFHQGFLQ